MFVSRPDIDKRRVRPDQHGGVPIANSLVLIQLAERVEITRARREDFDEQLGERRLRGVGIAGTIIDTDVGRRI